MYEVEKIVEHRLASKKGHYDLFIKWLNFPASENSWEPLSGLYDTIKEMIDDYFLKENQKVTVDKRTGKTTITSLQKMVPIVDKKQHSPVASASTSTKKRTRQQQLQVCSSPKNS